MWGGGVIKPKTRLLVAVWGGDCRRSRGAFHKYPEETASVSPKEQSSPQPLLVPASRALRDGFLDELMREFLDGLACERQECDEQQQATEHL